MFPTVDAHIYPYGGFDILSHDEVARLRDASIGSLRGRSAAVRSGRVVRGASEPRPGPMRAQLMPCKQEMSM